MTDDTDLTPEYIDSVCRAAPFADNDAGIPQMVALIRALSARLAEVEKQLKATLDREVATHERHDARLTEVEAELATAVSLGNHMAGVIEYGLIGCQDAVREWDRFTLKLKREKDE